MKRELVKWYEASYISTIEYFKLLQYGDTSSGIQKIGLFFLILTSSRLVDYIYKKLFF